MEFVVEKILFPIFLILLLGIIVCIPMAVYESYSKSKLPTFALKKDEWICTRNIVKERTYFVLVGKVAVPQHTKEEICVQWNKKENL